MGGAKTATDGTEQHTHGHVTLWLNLPCGADSMKICNDFEENLGLYQIEFIGGVLVLVCSLWTPCSLW